MIMHSIYIYMFIKRNIKVIGVIRFIKVISRLSRLYHHERRQGPGHSYFGRIRGFHTRGVLTGQHRASVDGLTLSEHVPVNITSHCIAYYITGLILMLSQV